MVTGSGTAAQRFLSTVPKYFKNITQWWRDSKTTDEDYVIAVNYLANKHAIPLHFSSIIPMSLIEKPLEEFCRNYHHMIRQCVDHQHFNYCIDQITQKMLRECPSAK